MGSILGGLLNQLGGDGMRKIGQAIGADEKTTESATTAALTTMLGALSRNAAQGDGAQSLNRALEKDHDGSVLNNLGALVGQSQQGTGDGILRHMLGDRRTQVETGLSKSTGLQSGSMNKLMTMLAPAVMGALGRERKTKGFDAGALTNLLGQETAEIKRANPQAAGVLGKLLDADGDGDFDLKDGIGMLGKLFGK
ncbi:MAG: DUF937 domain-containing protein [bacterium]|nr:DUF937 domain-containing protein [bacterium]